MGAVIDDLLLGATEVTEVRIAYLDAFPHGIELELTATTSDPRAGLSVGSTNASDLRVQIQFADGRKIAPRSLGRSTYGSVVPVGAPLPDTRCRWGKWFSPLPPPGPVTIVCQWPAARFGEHRVEIDGGLILAAATRAEAMFADPAQVARDGHTWRVGTDADLAWIREGVEPRGEITYAIPAGFAAYCTLGLPNETECSPHGATTSRTRQPESLDAHAEHERAVMDILRTHTPEQAWWLGYLDTGASDVVFPYAPRTKLYFDYGYVFVSAGPDQAQTWRDDGFNWALPDIMFPTDRSWMVSQMWDDDWTCLGGSEAFVQSFLAHPLLGPRVNRPVP